MKVRIAFVVCLALAGGVSAADKKQPGKGRDAEFKKLDTNNDGLLSPREFAAGSDAEKPGRAFAKLDSDKNGMISAAEFRSPGQAKAKKKK